MLRGTPAHLKSQWLEADPDEVSSNRKKLFVVMSDEQRLELKAETDRDEARLAVMESQGQKDSVEWLAVLAKCVSEYIRCGDTSRGPHLAKKLVSAVRRMDLEDSDTGRFAYNQLSCFAFLLRTKSDYGGALRMDQPALSYLDRMGAKLDDEYAHRVRALALDHAKLGDSASAITLLESYKCRLKAQRAEYSSYSTRVAGSR